MSHCNFYVEADKERRSDDDIFTASEGEIYFNSDALNFYIRKKREGDEISNLAALPEKAQKLFTEPGGSRDKEWQTMIAPDAMVRADGTSGPAVKVWVGKDAERLMKEFPDRIIPSRWHEKWKDKGSDFDNGLRDPDILPHLAAKPR